MYGTRITHGLATLAGAALFSMAAPTLAQNASSWRPVARLDSGTQLTIRTSTPIDITTADGRVYTGVVDQDVYDRNGQLAIPRGATVELLARPGTSDEIRLD